MDGHRMGLALGAAMAAVVLGFATPATARPRCTTARRAGPRDDGIQASRRSTRGRRPRSRRRSPTSGRTEAVYLAVIANHGEVRPFSNTVHAETRHADSSRSSCW